MARKDVELFNHGGVDSRSNPLNYPFNRSLRCKNFCPQPDGRLQLRHGYTAPTMSTVSAATIHSAIYYEQWNGTQYIIFGQGTNVKRMALADGTITTLGTVTNANPWGHYRANNRIFFGNATDFKFYDGTTLRNVGLRVLNSTESGAVTVSEAAGGSFNTTSLTGYRFYVALYNATTGHVGNRIAVGNTLTITGANKAVVLTGLPNLSSEDTELQKLIGRTNDGGQIPFAVVNAAGAYIVAGNTATVATVTAATIDVTQEMPTRNTVPPAMDKFAWVFGRPWGSGDANNLHYLRHGESEEDDINGYFTGRPEESWAANAAEGFPTGEKPTCVRQYDYEGWFFSKNHLAIYSELMSQIGSNPWRGPYPAGCAGQRAFAETPYGPYWLSGEKQLMTFDGGSPVPVSEEYERSLLEKISDSNMSTVEVEYLRDPLEGIDRLYILGKDSNNAPIIVIHDFKLRDDRSPFGQGYEFSYESNMTPTTLVRVRDTSGKARLWAGASNGRFYQLESGVSDSGSTFTGDKIGFLNFGTDQPRIDELQWQGDANLTVSVGHDLDMALAELSSKSVKVISAKEFRYRVGDGAGKNHLYYRLQLVAHPSDGNYTLADPPHLPVSSYGIIHAIRPKLGRERPLAR